MTWTEMLAFSSVKSISAGERVAAFAVGMVELVGMVEEEVSGFEVGGVEVVGVLGAVPTCAIWAFIYLLPGEDQIVTILLTE